MTLHLANRVLETLENHGFEAYYVGGCVRDWLLSRPVHDIDICTNAHPGDVIRLFPDHVPTGLKHGTVSVRIEGQFFEVTTYRTEGKYEDYRRPADVQFVSDLRLDLERRDFTMNAMAMNRMKELQDPFGGQADMAARLVRAVGQPLERFREDALRLLRAVRFAAQLGFAIEARTLAAMSETASLLAHIAVERVREELNKMLGSQAPQIGCDLINETELFGYSPVLQRLFRDSASAFWRSAHVNSLPQKWALLFYAAQFTSEEAIAACQLLRMSKRETEAIGFFVEQLRHLQPEWDQPKPLEWGQLLLEAGWEKCEQLAQLLLACWWNQQPQAMLASLSEQYHAMPVKTMKELAITGLDLQLALQKKPGEWIVHVLRTLLRQAALHGLPNTPHDLIEAAKKEVAQDEH
ncbi:MULTISPECIES: CCA tRNA nucleotidyltransferase [Brevibacillus]|uniref:CCA tRNA nucleotidyltransferase n=1 Tax=Brevibacillus TaxID=55080 RepID=UPI00156A8E51|nr:MULTISPECIES: CCA tRNA nucleotidyltransferase [Brevibacillus]MBU8712191.1 CCA tRNA nucleotidyltransferase [Brevibacillus parabrevis]UED71489.1 CCA tRNA nucleotidyltransferase [Brevibacillus sp. HD3.3A]